MSRENVEMARRGIAAWNREDVDAVLELLHPEIEMAPVLPRLVEGEDTVYKGISGFRRFWDDWRKGWDFRFGEAEFRDLGDTVLMLTRVSVTGRDGLDLDTPMAVVFRVEAGRLVRMDSYLDPAEAFEAVGLGE